MKVKGKQLSLMLMALTGYGYSQGVSAQMPAVEQTLYALGSQKSFAGPEHLFTGQVQVEMLFPEKEQAHFSAAYVTFAPGARTAWHTHPAGQHMIVTEGIALTGTRDGNVIEFSAGETVWCPPDIDHWHGATPHAPMTHLVITGSRDGKNVVWKEKFTDAEYGLTERTKAAANFEALNARQQALIPIAAYTATGNQAALEQALAAGLDAGLTINEVREVQVHLYAYSGFPRALNGLVTLMKVIDARKAAGVEDAVGADRVGWPTGGGAPVRLRARYEHLLAEPSVWRPVCSWRARLSTA